MTSQVLAELKDLSWERSWHLFIDMENIQGWYGTRVRAFLAQLSKDTYVSEGPKIYFIYEMQTRSFLKQSLESTTKVDSAN